MKVNIEKKIENGVESTPTGGSESKVNKQSMSMCLLNLVIAVMLGNCLMFAVIGLCR